MISITDGQIYLQPELFAAGVRPAINVGISVSRVGGNAQIKAMKEVAGSLRIDLAAYRELEAFAQLGTELDAASQQQLNRGAQLVELLKQGQYTPFKAIDQAISIYAASKGFLDDLALKNVHDFEEALIEYMNTTAKETREKIEKSQSFKGVEDELNTVIKEFKASFTP